MKNYLVITGASKGIGKSTAALFVKDHWEVINISRSNCDIEGVINFHCDLSEENWEAKIIDDLLAAINSPHKICLIHNAANYVKDAVQTINATQIRAMFETNIVAPTILNRKLIPIMPKGSSIIYIGSTLAEKAVANAASYITTKHATAGLMKATCQDLASSDIHTCCICPGFTETEMLMSHLKNDPEIIASITENVAAKRLIKPEEIASLAHYCANNPVINGTLLHANLGQIER